MELLLKEDVPGLGTRGEIITVARGYARNYLLPKGLAEVPTPEAIRRLRGIPGLTVIGSGGIRNGVDVAKALALGAELAGLAYPFLQAATESAERVVDTIRRAVRELKISMFCVGAANLAELARVRIVPPGERDDS